MWTTFEFEENKMKTKSGTINKITLQLKNKQNIS
jgi:hypothetical protein